MVCLQYEESFIPVQDQEQQWYGGDQAWFMDQVGKNGGCGVVAAANITAYLALHHKGLEGLYEQPGMERKYFLEHMKTLAQYVRPWKIPFTQKTFGVWPAFRMYRGVERYARERGILLTKSYIKSYDRWDKIKDFVERSLLENCPVAMLIGKLPRYQGELVERPDGIRWKQTHFAFHWVVITAMEERQGRTFVKVSTWGGWSWLDLEAWSDAKGIFPGLIRFLP